MLPFASPSKELSYVLELKLVKESVSLVSLSECSCKGSILLSIYIKKHKKSNTWYKKVIHNKQIKNTVTCKIYLYIK